MTVQYNIARLKYLLDLYKMSEQELLSIISEGLQRQIGREEVFGSEIKLSHLKKIDKIFCKGLSFYMNPDDPVKRPETSIFFRKNKFNSNLNLEARKIINRFEEQKLSLSAIASLSDITIDRSFPVVSIKNDPKRIANEIRSHLYPQFSEDQRRFLKNLINSLAAYNVLVLEFIETWNQTNKANIDGFFLSPNVIVLKRHDSKSFRREIFTLAHEFGHYLIDMEEVDSLDYETAITGRRSAIEKWCNDFAFHFLIGPFEQTFANIKYADSGNDYAHDTIDYLVKNTHLSEIALYTRLLIGKKILRRDYDRIVYTAERNANAAREAEREEEKRQRELDKANGKEITGGSPKPINSNLLISTLMTAFNEGVIDEYEVCKTLRISPDKINYIF